jgi:FixJ family two-component response regulator
MASTLHPTIAIVDDNASVRDSLRALLESYCFSVTEFSSGTDFLSQRHDISPDCVIVDLQMPPLSGMDVIARLRAAGDPTPAILMTGSVDAVAETQARAMGVPLLDKPFHRTALFAALDRALGRPAAGPSPAR